jgi:hypothetical protein
MKLTILNPSDQVRGGRFQRADSAGPGIVMCKMIETKATALPVFVMPSHQPEAWKTKWQLT